MKLSFQRAIIDLIKRKLFRAMRRQSERIGFVKIGLVLKQKIIQYIHHTLFSYNAKSSAKNNANSVDDKHVEGGNACGYFVSNSRRWFAGHIPLGTQWKSTLRNWVNDEPSLCSASDLATNRKKSIYFSNCIIHFAQKCFTATKWYAASMNIPRHWL